MSLSCNAVEHTATAVSFAASSAIYLLQQKKYLRTTDMYFYGTTKLNYLTSSDHVSNILLQEFISLGTKYFHFMYNLHPIFSKITDVLEMLECLRSTSRWNVHLSSKIFCSELSLNSSPVVHLCELF